MKSAFSLSGDRAASEVARQYRFSFSRGQRSVPALRCEHDLQAALALPRREYLGIEAKCGPADKENMAAMSSSLCDCDQDIAVFDYSRPTITLPKSRNPP